jgi:hypothetical protein
VTLWKRSHLRIIFETIWDFEFQSTIFWNDSNFRVNAPVARRTPHRSGREGLPHPVPRFQSFLTRLEAKQAMAHLAHNFAALQTSSAVVVDSGFGKRKFVKNRVHILSPVYVAFVGSSTQPIPPISSRLVDNLAKQPDVTNNAVVLIVTTEFNAQHFVLFLQR